VRLCIGLAGPSSSNERSSALEQEPNIPERQLVGLSRTRHFLQTRVCNAHPLTKLGGRKRAAADILTGHCKMLSVAAQKLSNDLSAQLRRLWGTILSAAPVLGPATLATQADLLG
jgi:hypothetical protein